MKFIFTSILILAFFFNLQAPNLVRAQGLLETDLPCWMYQPVRGDTVGVIGVARDANANGGGGKFAAILNALAKLATYFDVKLDKNFDAKQIEKDLKAGNSIFKMGTHQFKFVGEVSKKGIIYVYLIHGDKDLSLGEPEATCSRACQPKSCKPSWLCNPMTQDKAGFLGISGRATSKTAQFKRAVTNTVAQADYLYGVQVDVEEEFSTRINSLGAYKFRFRDRSIKKKQAGGAKSIRFLVTDTCSKGSELFLRVTTEELKPKPTLLPEIWMVNPNFKGHLGAVGSADKVSSGNLSDQIKLAIEKAVGNLALSKKLEITSSMTLKQNRKRENQSSNGSFFYRDLKNSASLELKADVMGLYFEDLGQGKRRVNAWVVEHSP
ncbi:MAG: hypothetical protein QNL04_02170 [SAR324 cluster bacterium]|nr:hypothetical protein [SAR324 cluster bacterium]